MFSASVADSGPQRFASALFVGVSAWVHRRLVNTEREPPDRPALLFRFRQCSSAGVGDLVEHLIHPDRLMVDVTGVK